MSKVVYGYPSPALIDMKQEKGWILGGCTPSDIQFICKSCDSFFSSETGFQASKP
jgi:hypothetical protein